MAHRRPRRHEPNPAKIPARGGLASFGGALQLTPGLHPSLDKRSGSGQHDIAIRGMNEKCRLQGPPTGGLQTRLEFEVLGSTLERYGCARCIARREKYQRSKSNKGRGISDLFAIQRPMADTSSSTRPESLSSRVSIIFAECSVKSTVRWLASR